MTLNQAKEKIAQAYQVIGNFVHNIDEGNPNINHSEILRAQDYFASDLFDPTFLPWPRNEWSSPMTPTP